MPLFSRQRPPTSSTPDLPTNVIPIIRQLKRYKPDGHGIYRTFLSLRHLRHTPKDVAQWLIDNASKHAEQGASLDLVAAMLERARHNATQCSWAGDTARLLLEIARLQLKVGLMEFASLDVKFKLLESADRTLDALDQTTDGFVFPGRRLHWSKSIQEVRKGIQSARSGVWETDEGQDEADDSQEEGPA